MKLLDNLLFMEFAIALTNGLISLLSSFYIIKKVIINNLSISNKVLKILSITTIGAIIFEVLLFLLTTLVVLSCGGGVCDMAYIALIFWLPFYFVITLIVTTRWVKKIQSNHPSDVEASIGQ